MTTLIDIETELGNFTLALEEDKAPITVANFLAYVDGGHVKGMTAYRIVTKGNQPAGTEHRIEVVQWGYRAENGAYADLFAPIAHEPTSLTGIRHENMTISMARFAPGSAGAGFFICIGAQPELDEGGRRNPDLQGFAAFGKVSEGEDVVRAIFAKAEPDSEQPAVPVQFLGATRR